MLLLNPTWPGNVRELLLVIERAGWLVENGSLPAQALTEAIALGAPAEAAPPPGRSLDSERLVAACEASGWDVKAAAQLLGISRATLYRHLRAHHVQSHRLSLGETRAETGETRRGGPRPNSFRDNATSRAPASTPHA